MDNRIEILKTREELDDPASGSGYHALDAELHRPYYGLAHDWADKLLIDQTLEEQDEEHKGYPERSIPAKMRTTWDATLWLDAHPDAS